PQLIAAGRYAEPQLGCSSSALSSSAVLATGRATNAVPEKLAPIRVSATAFRRSMRRFNRPKQMHAIQETGQTVAHLAIAGPAWRLRQEHHVSNIVVADTGAGERGGATARHHCR